MSTLKEKMMERLDEDEVGVLERVKCPCGSEVLLKNLKAHEKTKKHINGGIVVRKSEYDKSPATLAVEKTCMGETKYLPLPKVKVLKDDKVREVKLKDGKDEKDEEDDEDDEEDFEEMVLDDLKTLSDKMDQVLDLLNAGFSTLLGGSLDDIKECDEKAEKDEKESK